MEPAKGLQEVASQVAVCKLCQLSYSRKKAVPGEGPASAEIMLIGEGPGFYENEQGRPFVGAAGNFLNELLGKAGVSRKDVFITNVVKCRPPGNRDPLPDELSACNTYLETQIGVINPLVIVTLGRYSMAKFLPNVRISEVHGQPAWVRGRLIIPMFHPAAALHQPSLKTSVERDFTRLPEWIQQARTNGHQAASLPSNSDLQGSVSEEFPASTETNVLSEAHSSYKTPPLPESAGMLFDPDELEQEKPTEQEDPAQPSRKDRPTQLSLF
ncbi:MAG: uracil-DNA glycosylase [Anaerolineaceae bacterium]|nr:uracil-DNA glycosylase [Anaerolineaceae bacterium]